MPIWETQETWVQSLGQEDPLEEGMATYSRLENSMNRGAWWAAISGVAQSQTRLKRLSSSSGKGALLYKSNSDILDYIIVLGKS